MPDFPEQTYQKVHYGKITYATAYSIIIELLDDNDNPAACMTIVACISSNVVEIYNPFTDEANTVQLTNKPRENERNIEQLLNKINLSLYNT